jgi:hypothetical protein
MPQHLIIAWIASAVANSAAFGAWVFISAGLNGSPPPAPKGFLRLMLFAFGSSLMIQIVYGGLLYIALKRFGLFNFPVVLLAYLIPVILFSWHASDTSNELIGTIPWLVFGSILALVFWFFASSR